MRGVATARRTPRINPLPGERWSIVYGPRDSLVECRVLEHRRQLRAPMPVHRGTQVVFEVVRVVIGSAPPQDLAIERFEERLS